MRNLYLYISFAFLILNCNEISAQVKTPGFGKGIQVLGQDSSFYLQFGFRFQTLYQSSWNLQNDELSSLEDHSSSMFIRRSRLKFGGWALTPKFSYKLELALSNRDNGGGNSDIYNNAANIILDAYVSWNFYKGFSLWAGQGKMLGNRERIISSGNLQFVDRSRLNSRYNIDRDVGIMLLHKHKVGDNFVIQESISISSGEGKNVTSGNLGGKAYAGKIELFPFGEFKSKGAYVGSAVKYEEDPKLALAMAYDKNIRAGRSRGQLGSYLFDSNGASVGKDLSTFFMDLMFKYRNWSIMTEYANKKAQGSTPQVFDDNNNLVGTYYTGSGINFSIGYMMKNNVELAVRWTDINPEEEVASPESQYTLGLSKYIVGHKLKIQTDLTYRSIDLSEDDLIFRMQMDFHF